MDRATDSEQANSLRSVRDSLGSWPTVENLLRFYPFMRVSLSQAVLLQSRTHMNDSTEGELVFPRSLSEPETELTEARDGGIMGSLLTLSSPVNIAWYL